MQQSNEHKSHECTLSDQELITICTEWIQKLIDSGGKEWCMFVPARPNKDPDLLFSELVERFKAKLSQPQSEGGTIDKLEILKRHYFKYYRPSYPSDERTKEVVDMALSIKEETACILAAMDEYKRQSEGGLQWVNCSDTKTLPDESEDVIFRFVYNKSALLYPWEFLKANPERAKEVEWLKESASPSTANTEEGAEKQKTAIAFHRWMELESWEHEYREQRAFSIEEFYELFLTETKQQQ